MLVYVLNGLDYVLTHQATLGVRVLNLASPPTQFTTLMIR